jgi:hypothetical protein
MKFAKNIGTDMIGFIATIALASLSYAPAGVMVFPAQGNHENKTYRIGQIVPSSNPTMEAEIPAKPLPIRT